MKITCRRCGCVHSYQEFVRDRFCRKCGTFLVLPKVKPRKASPSIRISPKRPISTVKFRRHLETDRVEISSDVGYFLGLFLARGALREDVLVVRIPCKSTNTADHKDFLLRYVVPRMEEATGEKIKVYGDRWADYSFDIIISNDFFRQLLRTLDYRSGEVCRYAGVPHEVFHSNADTMKEFVRGIGDCCGEVDRYISGRPRVVLRFLNENTLILEDVVELLLLLGLEIFDVNISPASSLRPRISGRIDKLTENLGSMYGLSVTGRQEKTGRDNMIRMWADDYQTTIGFNHPLRKNKLQKYLNS